MNRAVFEHRMPAFGVRTLNQCDATSLEEQVSETITGVVFPPTGLRAEVIAHAREWSSWRKLACRIGKGPTRLYASHKYYQF